MSTIYERQVDESTKAFSGFVAYRDLGVQRSLGAAWKQYNKSDRTVPGYFKQWSADYNWVARAAAYDDYIDAKARKKLEIDAINRRADMLRRHSLTGKVLQQKGVDYLTREGGPGIDKGADAIAAIKTGITIERQAESLPEHLMAIVEATDDELARAYADLLAQVSGNGSGDAEAGNVDPQAGTATPDEPA